MTTIRGSIPTKLPASDRAMEDLRRKLAALAEALSPAEPAPEPVEPPADPAS